MYSNRILITGASGVIGQALKNELISTGYSNVIALSSVDADLRNELQTYKLFDDLRPAVVYHLAARVHGIMGNLQNKADVYLDNIRINTNVIDAARVSGAKKIVAMGSSAIYSDNIPLPMSESQIWNGPPHYSEAAYAHAKRSMLAQLEACYEQYGMDYAFCISTNLYGPYDKFDEKWGHVIPSLISKFYRANHERTSVSVWGTGKAKRDFLYSEDAACAMRLIGEQVTGPINFATGNTYSIRETVETICKVSGFEGEVIWDSTKPDGQHLREYDITKLQDLGFIPKSDLYHGLRKTYEWFEANVRSVRR